MTVTCSPTYPVAGEEVTLSQTVTISGTTVTIELPAFDLTSVPPNSAVATGVLVDDADVRIATVTPDVSGDYAFTVTAYDEFAAPPAYDGDGAGVVRQVVTTSESYTLRVGEQMDLPIVALGHSLTLRLKVHNGTVTSASLVTSTTDKAYAASQDATVATKLAALVGVAASSIGPSLADAINTFATAYNAHRTNATAHPSGSGDNDTVNVFLPSRPYDLSQTIVQINQLRAVLYAHLTGASTNTISWHNADDTKNIIVAPPATDLASAIVLYADLWRVYEAHRVQIAAPASHPGADAVNTLGAVDKLSDLIKTVLAYFANASPTVPTGLEDGAVQLGALYGFRKVAT